MVERLSINKIEETKKIRRDTFKKDKDILNSYITINIERKEEYNGRQIFEMLQNIDDQESGECLIELDIEEKCLTFYNNGKPFSTEGIQSIMLPHISPKKDKKFIGNKGLGFRAILNWSENIEIFSDEKIFNFSQEIAEKYFGSPNIPLLTFPETSTKSLASDWVTYVRLKNINDENIKKIKEELYNFNDKLLLFLHHLQDIQIKINGTVIIEYSASKPKQINPNIIERKIWDNETEKDITYWIFNKNYPIQEELCNIQIAVETDGNINERYELFNFFPTQHLVNLPCILHATLEMESSRNYIKSNNKKNEIILTEHIPSAFQEFAEFIKQKSLENNKNYWKAYKLLSAPKYSDDKHLRPMYEKILAKRDNGEFCPCIDKQFRNITQVKNYNPKINVYFKDNNCADIFPEIVINGYPEDFPQQIYEASSFNCKIEEQVTKSNLDDEATVNLIDILYKIRKIEIEQGIDAKLETYNILKDENGDYIKEGNALTPQNKENMIEFPEYLHYKYLTKDFCNKFYEKFEKEIEFYKENDAGNAKRSFINNLKNEYKLLNITFYDRNNLIPEIISQCRILISAEEKTQADKNKIIGQMLKALYKNIEDDDLTNKEIPVYANKDNNIIKSTDLLFPQAKEIYEDILPDNIYLKDFPTLNFLENEQTERKNKFLKSIGVQPWVRFESVTIKYDNRYISFLQDIKVLPEGSRNYVPLSENFDVIALKDSENIKKLNTENFQKLLQNEPKLKNTILEEKQIKWLPKSCQNFSLQVINFSFVAYQLKNYADYVILDFNNKTIEELGYKHIKLTDRDYEVFIKLGAKNTIEDFSTKELYDLMKKVKENNIIPNQNFYKVIFDALKNRDENFAPYENDLYLLAYTNNGREFRKNSEVYYDDNKSLGKIYLSGNYPIFILYPKLGAERVCNVFGTKRIDESKRKIIKNIPSPINKDFQKDFSTYLPYFLAIRINDKQMGAQQKEKMANSLKQIKIELVEELISSFGKDSGIVLEENTFCIKDEVYYIKTSKENIGDLHEDISFCQCISDILCIEMEASSEERDYKNCFCEKKLYKDMLANDTDLKEEIQRLLGYSDSEINFYKNIINKLDIKNKYPEFENNNEKISDIKSDLSTNYEFKFDLKDNDMMKYDKIKGFAQNNNINASELLDNTENIIDFYNVNKANFESVIKCLLNDFKHKLWESLNKKTDLQENFIDIITSDIPNIIDLEKIRIICKENKDFEYDYKKMIIEIMKNETWSKNKPEINYDELQPDEKWQEQICKCYADYENNEIIQQNNKLRSLLFFEGNDEKLQKAIKEQEMEQKEYDTQKSPHLIEADWILSSTPKPKSRKGNVHKRSGSGRVNQSQLNKQGKNAELQVIDFLKSCGYYPEHVSGNSNSENRSDAYHYDIRYIDENNNEKLVEVKSTCNCDFYMSDEELQFAKKEENKNKYRLAIVKDGKVKFIDNFAELIEENKYFCQKTDTWKFYFEIESDY